MPVILHAVGARPNFVKMAPVVDALRPHANIEQRLVHTGQHYDAMMSDELFVDLELPEPDISLGVGSGTHGEQTGRVLIAFERILLDARPDLVVVAGDVNSTVACALAAAKLGRPPSWASRSPTWKRACGRETGPCRRRSTAC
jgi:UDP-N-acetylglucosamine 2-epimerase (non-hydrolysing)